MRIQIYDKSKNTAVTTAEEAARHLRVHIKSLYRLAQEGKVPARKVGGQWRFHIQTLDEWLKSGREEIPQHR
jgi:excisionase family DNA binding protein